MSYLSKIAEIENNAEKMKNEDVRLLLQAFKVMVHAAEGIYCYYTPGGDYWVVRPWENFESNMKTNWEGKIEGWSHGFSRATPHSIEIPYVDDCSMCNADAQTYQENCTHGSMGKHVFK